MHTLVNALSIRSWGDVRALVHVAAPALAAILVAKSWADDTLAGLIVALVLAVASPVLATANTGNGFRRWFYPVAGAASAIGIYLGYVTDADYTTWLPLITLLIGPAVAAANTPTSIDPGSPAVAAEIDPFARRLAHELRRAEDLTPEPRNLRVDE